MFFARATDLGDSAFAFAVTLLLVVYLFWMQERRAALSALAAFFIASFFIACGKILLYSQCIPVKGLLGLQSPSGHTALSMAVYFTIASIVASSLPKHWRLAPYLVSSILVSTVAISRVILRAHTQIDVLLGFLAGAVAWLISRRLIKGHAVACPWMPFIVIATGAFAIFYGHRFPAEKAISWISGLFRHSFCVADSRLSLPLFF